ncbi:hypothetical protein Vretimale_5696 [Volvox reticuliferus]|uniref:Uncharacterized protein n=1 Tax=Volvox reticuliferus TaxID=1737510 RepID=A0A8J4G614_9CHLO|nr:hypothetical protein Vretifemale_5796 [Volvox reticuliferus]GIM00771.1 hypothetical protein Vretimale_5696 [Volvox reticuliferus]
MPPPPATAAVVLGSRLPATRPLVLGAPPSDKEDKDGTDSYEVHIVRSSGATTCSLPPATTQSSGPPNTRTCGYDTGAPPPHLAPLAAVPRVPTAPPAASAPHPPPAPSPTGSPSSNCCLASSIAR